VVSARGPGGGYRLATDAEAVTIAAIVHAVDEPLRSTRCAAERGCLVKGDKCITHDLWEGLDNQIEAYLASVSLADVARGRLAARERAA
jgi:Rrf2 family iron-sulfur cluster assembly transcriptional regulator